MSRRDTIIIAVLINASLLAFLFVMAINNDGAVIGDSRDFVEEVVHNQPIQKGLKQGASIPVIQMSSSDEIDNFLKDVSMAEITQPVLIQETISSVSEQKPDEEHFVDIVVKRGDVLSKIAQANNSTVSAIKKANKLSSEKLTIGQVLKVPVNIAKKSVQTHLPPAAFQQNLGESEVEYYVIKSGDNPWKIAKQFHVKFDDLLKLNQLDEERARNLKIGDKIRVK